MAYEVTKRIGGREYRYRVESVRDEASGKRRNRWTYIGRIAGPRAEPPPPRKRRSDARERLLDALERLVAERDFADVTADAVASAAGLAHGTFYRHFRDKRDALKAALERVRERSGPVIDLLRDDVETVEEARAGLRSLVERILAFPAEHPALLRAYFGLVLRDRDLACERSERKARGIARLTEHLVALAARGLATTPDPQGTATALFAMLEGFFRERIADGTPIVASHIAAAAEVMDRAVFSGLARKEAS